MLSPLLDRTGFVILTLVLFPNMWLHCQVSGWSSPLNISNKYGYTVAPAMATSSRGKVFVAWEGHYQSQNRELAQIYLASGSKADWTPPIAITDTGQYDRTPAIAVDTTGNPHVVWGEQVSGDIFYSRFDGQSWTYPMNLSQNAGASFYPYIAIDHANRVHVVWHDESFDGDPSIFYRCYDGGQWSETINVSDSLEYSINAKIAIDSHDGIHVTWCSRMPPDDNRDIFYRSLKNGTWSSIARLTEDTLYSINPSIAIQKNDAPFVVWDQVVDVMQDPIVDRICWSTAQSGVWPSPLQVSELSRSFTPSIDGDELGNVYAVWTLNVRVHGVQHNHILYSKFSDFSWNSLVTVSDTLSLDNPFAPVVRKGQDGTIHVIFNTANDAWPPVGDIYYVNKTETNYTPMIPTERNPVKFSLAQNYPNPFNGSTVLEFDNDATQWVLLEIYNILGERIAQIVNERLTPGKYKATFSPRGLTSGVYFARIKSKDKLVTKTILYVK